jgi:predicted nucleic-acid-binding protein
VKVTVDTNALVRAIVREHKMQSRAAIRVLREADVIAVPLLVFCEPVWVLRRVSGIAEPDIATTVEALVQAANVTVNRVAVEEGLELRRAGGDFADGLIAVEGQQRGGDTFVSIDKQAASLIAGKGQPARLLP